MYRDIRLTRGLVSPLSFNILRYMSHTAPSLRYIILRLSSAFAGETFECVSRTRGNLLIVVSYDMDISCLMGSRAGKRCELRSRVAFT